MTDLSILGGVVREPVLASALETFPAPENCREVMFRTGEFTAMCPVTQQPDLYDVTIRYEPVGRCIESKSLKLYLWGFRDQGIFAEGIAAQLADAIHEATAGAPTAVRVIQNVRGGIVTTTYAQAGEGLWAWDAR